MRNYILRRLLPALSLLCAFSVTAQKQLNHWIISPDHNGAYPTFHLDFNAGFPPSVTAEGMIHTDEGSSAVSDSNGNLLFYTDGDTVWDRNHNMMPNGYNLKGAYTSTQAALITPHPGSDTLY